MCCVQHPFSLQGMSVKALPEISTTTSDRLPHMPQLDGLRAIAVAAVLIHHYIEGGWGLGANLGVKLFFVLSGFLITSILIRSRNLVKAQEGSKGIALRHFYVRRFLRIFPLYYFVVAIGLLINLEPAREYMVWLLTYTLNIRMSDQGWFIDHFAHFWTLAVEEQFYLIWPWFVLFIPRKWLIHVAICMILTGPLYRLYHVLGWVFFESDAGGLRTYIFTLTCFDTLGMGSLLALVMHLDHPKESISKLVRIALPTSLVGVSLLFVARFIVDDWVASLVLADVFVALFFCWLVSAAATGFRGPFGTILRTKPMRYLGKISYGLYVYHPFMPLLVALVFARLGWTYEEYAWTSIVLATLSTLAISSLSWHLMERPANALKRYFV